MPEEAPPPHLPSEELALFVEAVEDYAIFLLSPKGVIRSWNRGAERIMGYSAAEAVGREFSIFYEPDDLAGQKPQHELETAAAEGRVEDEGWRIRKDGSRFWANTIITALRNPAGQVTAFAKVTRDMTGRRQAEEQLRQSEEMFRLLVASVKDYAIFLIDPDGYVVTWNEGAQHIKGYLPQEIIGRHFSTFYPESDVRDGKPEHELAVAREQGSVEDEGWRVRKDGTTFWANVLITAVHDAHGRLRGFAKVTRDASDRRRAEDVQAALLEQREARLEAEEEKRRAEASYRAAQEANRAKDEFLMTLSHELRTPMTAILGWARLLPTLPVNDQSFHDAVGAIGRSAQLQARLIDDVLDVSRIVSGKLRLSMENVDVARLLHSAIDAVRASAEAKGIAIVTAFDESLGTTVADPTRLQQVVWNLLTNAVKFTPKRGTIELSGRRTASRLQVTVRDSGDGIEPSFLPHIFEPFRQAESPYTRVHGGLGLGLSIVRYIAEAHGGSVSAESEGKGSGTVFTVTLPISATALPRAPAAPPVAPRKLAGWRVLLVDDDREARELIRAVLRNAGAAVTAVESAAGALDALDGERPDLMITDVAMPGMDGFALAREIRGRPDLEGMKVVALSAFPPKRGKAQEEFLEYFTKPVDPFALVDALAKLLKAA
jgi:PAS domain S-box-containing protein